MTYVRHYSSIWDETHPIKVHFPPLASSMATDICVIGGGITGLTTAYILAREGKKVALLESHELGAGTSGGTTAHLDPLTDNFVFELIEKFGQEMASQILDSGMKSIDFIEQTSSEHQIDCEFKRVPGTYFTEKEEDLEQLEREQEAGLELGLHCRLIKQSKQPYPCLAALQFHHHAQFHPLKYMDGLMQECLKHNVQFFERTRVSEVHGGSSCKVVTETGHEVKCRQVVMATQIPIGLMVSLQTRAFPYRSYVLGVRTDHKMDSGLFWDLDNPYHYYRKAQDSRGEVLLVGGADHKTGGQTQTDLCYLRLENHLRERIQINSIDYRWSAQFYDSADGLPYIGEAPFSRNIYVSTGFCGTGMSFGTVSAMIMAGQALGGKTPWDDLYSTGRVHALSSAKKFIKENVDVAEHFVKDRLTKVEKGGSSQVAKGEGKILSVSGERYAVYRDEHDELKVLSPVCTHAKCYVSWNQSEKTWDCPCHGGRYSTDGEVIYGPPLANLTKYAPAQIFGEEWAQAPAAEELNQAQGRPVSGGPPS